MPDEFDWQSENEEHDNDIPSDDLRFAPVEVSSDDGVDVSGITESDAIEETAEPRTLEDLTVAELIGQFIRAPFKTWRGFSQVTHASRVSDIRIPVSVSTSHRSALSSILDEKSSHYYARGWFVSLFTTKLNRSQVQLLLYTVAVVIGLIGSSMLMGPSGVQKRTETNALIVGSPFLWMSFFIWLIAEIYGNWLSIVDWWARQNQLQRIRLVLRLIFPLAFFLLSLLNFVDAMSAPPEDALGIVQSAINRFAIGVVLWILIEFGYWLINRIYRSNPDSLPIWLVATINTGDIPEDHIRSVARLPQLRLPFSWGRVSLTVLAILSSALIWLGTSNNRVSPFIIFIWFLNAGIWAFVFAPIGFNIFDWASDRIDDLRAIQWRRYSWAILAFLLIMILGIGFRLVQLDSLPSEMTSDHLEKLLDSARVYKGEYNIFFANNGGREPIQMYLMSIFSTLPGRGFDHYSLKLLAAIESLITLPILVWMGMEVVGKHNRRLGLLVGLLLAGLVAVSYWHTAITRQGLRIVLTPLFTALLVIYLSRAMRYNRRSDFVKSALILGFGLYAYQAIRMLPIVIVAGIGIAVLIRPIAWRERLTYGINLGVLVFVSFMVFLPMFHYSLEDSDHFWRRTAGRLLGDDVIVEEAADGRLIERSTTPEERIEAFNANVPILMNNIRNAVLMFNWKGDVAWISGVPNEPAMDRYTGTFLILGLAAWLALMLRRRDPVIWLMPVMVFIMLLPSALSIAYPLENPSHTRTSGAIPAVYLISAFPLGLISIKLVEVFSRRTGIVLAVILCSGTILLANNSNTSLYFDQYPEVYSGPSYPYSEAGTVLRGFAESDGTYGNAFMIAFPHWWGHREVGLAAGLTDWPNGIISRNDVPGFLNIAQYKTDRYKFDPNKDMLFFYSVNDVETSEQLKVWFPNGRESEIQSYQLNDIYMLYRVPFLGDEGFQQWLQEFLVQ